ncbi:hypothetical protein chiPu_0028023 [Chiloscyllium punctatum]|uniref:Uncharacterized protein n=1 Tax=Chiloscyllium punctatum TaxID=137246 RepID=A0A401TNE9_CHIPU|nr:hypothetical protein [Chiloscyllium punctatum]
MKLFAHEVDGCSQSRGLRGGVLGGEGGGFSEGLIGRDLMERWASLGGQNGLSLTRCCWEWGERSHMEPETELQLIAQGPHPLKLCPSLRSRSTRLFDRERRWV